MPMLYMGPAYSKTDQGHWKRAETSDTFCQKWKKKHHSWNTHENSKWFEMASTQEKKESGFLVYQLHNFHPTCYLKGDRAIGNSTLRDSFNLVQKQTNTNTVLSHVQPETGTAYQMGQIVSLKSSR